MEYKFKISKDNAIKVEVCDGVFTPTGTSDLLFSAALDQIDVPAKVLDLGCGSGVVGVALYKSGKVSAPLYASDLSVEAVECVKHNARKYSCDVDARAGSLLSPWCGEKFDYIVDDISGVAQDVAKCSEWFNNVPCASGVDGTSLVVDVIAQAKKYLNSNGKLLFPIISFSRKSKIMDEASRHFKKVECIKRQEWPLPKDMYASIELLKRLKDEGNVDFIEKFGMVIWYTEVYVAFEPIY